MSDGVGNVLLFLTPYVFYIFYRYTDLTFLLDLNETIAQLTMANSVFWYAYVLRREDGHVLRKALDFEVNGQRKKGRSKRTSKKQFEEGSVKVNLRRGDTLC